MSLMGHKLPAVRFIERLKLFHKVAIYNCHN
jgi:hypothetical protein